MDSPPSKHRILTLLNALREASRNLRTKTNNPFTFTSNTDSIDALLDLEAKSAAVFSADPNLRTLRHSLSTLKALIENLQSCQGYTPRSLLRRHITAYKISHAASAVESQIQAYLDRVTVHNLASALQEPHGEDEQVNALVNFVQRLSQGFDLNFQDLVLKAKIFTLLEHTLFENLTSKKVKEEAAVAIAALVKFNKNVFALFLMAGQSRKWMILIATIWIQAFIGTKFDFSQYSSSLKSALQISQVQLSYLAIANDMGKVFGWSMDGGLEVAGGVGLDEEEGWVLCGLGGSRDGVGGVAGIGDRVIAAATATAWPPEGRLREGGWW